MGLVIIWLLLSLICTALVLISFRFAPRLEDQDLDAEIQGLDAIESDGTGMESSDPPQVAMKRAPRKSLPATEGRALNSKIPSTRLASFGISRFEEPQA